LFGPRYRISIDKYDLLNNYAKTMLRAAVNDMGYWSAVFNINWYKIQIQKTTDETAKYNHIDEDLAYADKNN